MSSYATNSCHSASYISVSKGGDALFRLKIMINIKKTIIYIAAAILALGSVSCQKDDTLQYNNLTMGNIVDGRFVSDQGNTFNVVEQLCSGKIQEEKRIMMLCDVLNETKGGRNEYDVRLTTYFPVLEKKAVGLADATGDIEVQDPVHIEQLWFAGGYMNMVIQTPVIPGSDTKHLVNLVYSVNDNGEYVMNLRHNGYGEVWSPEKDSKMTLSGGAYVSFPIADLIKGDNAKIVLNWKWYESTELTFDYTKEKTYEFKYDWTRNGFIQNF